ncbi:MAG: hypothetical protein Q9162_004769 [Coniocarpon cinnabarinum]
MHSPTSTRPCPLLLFTNADSLRLTNNFSQKSSHLLDLPLELRLQILSILFQDVTLNVNQIHAHSQSQISYGRLGRCNHLSDCPKDLNNEDLLELHWHPWTEDPSYDVSVLKAKLGPLALLRSCRQLYHDGLRVLVQSANFVFPTLNGLLAFQIFLNSEQLSTCLQHVKLSLELRDFGQWEKDWREMSRVGARIQELVLRTSVSTELGGWQFNLMGGKVREARVRFEEKALGAVRNAAHAGLALKVKVFLEVLDRKVVVRTDIEDKVDAEEKKRDTAVFHGVQKQGLLGCDGR